MTRRRPQCPRPSIADLDKLVTELKYLVNQCKTKAGPYYPKNLLQEAKIQLCYLDRNGRRHCKYKTIPGNLIDLQKKADECLAGNPVSCQSYTRQYLKLIDDIGRLADALTRSVPPGSGPVGIKIATRCLPKRPQPGQGYIPGLTNPIRLQ